MVTGEEIWREEIRWEDRRSGDKRGDLARGAEILWEERSGDRRGDLV